jgi:hypothetical protein
LGLKLHEYKGPITRSKSKQLCIPGSGKHIPEISLDGKEMNNHEKNHKENLMKKDKEVEEVLQEIKKT